MQIDKSVDGAAQRLEYRLIDAVTAVQTWLVAMRAASDTAARQNAAAHAVQSLAQIERLAAHAAALLKPAEDKGSEK